MAYGSKVKEYGKAKEPPSLRLHTTAWTRKPKMTRQEKAHEFARKLRNNRRYQLIKERNALILQEALLEAGMLRLSKQKQRAKIDHAVQRYLNNTIRERKKMNLPTRMLKERLENRNKIVDRIMSVPVSKNTRKLQKKALVAMPASLIGGAAASTATNSIIPVGISAGGSIGAHIFYGGARKQIQEAKKSIRKRRREIEDQLI